MSSSTVDKLVDSITGLSPTSPTSRRAKQAAQARLTTHNFLRVNQFEVSAIVDGLIEKFHVRHRLDLADALSARLGRLTGLAGQKTPEYLAFLLYLSVDPVSFGHVKVSPRPVEAVAPVWADMMADVQYGSDEEIEQDTRGGDESDSNDDGSDSGSLIFSPSISSVEKTDSGLDNEVGADELASKLVYLPDEQLLDQIVSFDRTVANRHDRLKESCLPITIHETELCRQAITMARGFATPLFLTHSPLSHHFQLVHPVRLETTSVVATTSVLKDLVDLSSTVFILREWSRRSWKAAVLRAFQHELVTGLLEFDSRLAEMEASISASRPGCDGILGLARSISVWAEPLVPLSLIIPLEHRPDPPFSYLDRLFSEASLAQIAGKTDLFDRLSAAFFRCLRVYLRPVVRWACHGEIDRHDRFFFVESAFSDQVRLEEGDSSMLHLLWRDHVRVRTSEETGQALSPAFLRLALPTILSGGKTALFLQNLDASDKLDSPSDTLEPVLGLVGTESTDVLFSERVQSLLFCWFDGVTKTAQTHLLTILRHDLKLASHLAALNQLFLGLDSYAFSSFTTILFKHMGHGSRTYVDPFVATQICQATYDLAVGIDTKAIHISTPEQSAVHDDLGYLQQLKLMYQLPWFVRTIVTDDSVKILQRVFGLLLCVERARSSLGRDIFLFRTQNKNDREAHRACVQCEQLLNLRHRAFWFVTGLQVYIMADVINELASKLRVGMDGCGHMDELCDNYSRFTSELKRQCLLDDSFSSTLEQVLGLLDVGLEASVQTRRHLSLATYASTYRDSHLVNLAEAYVSGFEVFFDDIRAVQAETGDSNWGSLIQRLS